MLKICLSTTILDISPTAYNKLTFSHKPQLTLARVATLALCLLSIALRTLLEYYATEPEGAVEHIDLKERTETHITTYITYRHRSNYY